MSPLVLKYYFGNRTAKTNAQSIRLSTNSGFIINLKLYWDEYVSHIHLNISIGVCKTCLFQKINSAVLQCEQKKQQHSDKTL